MGRWEPRSGSGVRPSHGSHAAILGRLNGTARAATRATSPGNRGPMLSNGHIKSELSPQDQELISLLQWAPRITWGEAAEILGAHATTLAGRWEKLERSGLSLIHI